MDGCAPDGAGGTRGRFGYTRNDAAAPPATSDRAARHRAIESMILLYVAVAAALCASPRGCATRPRAAAAGRHRRGADQRWRSCCTRSRSCAPCCTPDGLDLSFPHALSLVAWLTVLVAGLSGVLAKLPAVGNVILPVAALCALAPLAGGSAAPVSLRRRAAGRPRTSRSRSSRYALFVVAALQALLLTGLEKRLHRGLARRGRRRRAAAADARALPVPPRRRRVRAADADARERRSVLRAAVRPAGDVHAQEPLLACSAGSRSRILLFGRWRYGWRGRRALYWILGGTALLVLGYLGSKFVAEILLGR